MEPAELVSLFAELEASAAIERDADVLIALPMPGYVLHRLARDVDGQPCLLIAVDADEAPERLPYGVRLEHLSVEHDIACRLVAPNGHVDRRSFTVIRCLMGDTALREYFLRIASVFVPAVGVHPTRRNISLSLGQFVELFRALAQPPRKSVQGLWAELFVISRCEDPALLVKAWHLKPEDRFDFSAQSARIEVKSDSSRTRQHHFSLSQLQAPDGVAVVIASVLVEQVALGTSIADLLGRIRTRVAHEPELALRAESVVAATLGAALPAALLVQFAEEVSGESLAFYDGRRVPGADIQPPPQVVEVSFRASLAHCPPLTSAEMLTAPALIRAAI